MSEAKKTYKPVCYWAGDATLIGKNNGLYQYAIDEIYPPGLIEVPWYQKGWAYIVKGKDDVIFVDKIEKHINNVSNSRGFIAYSGFVNRVTLYFTIPYEFDENSYIAPLNQFTINVSNQEVIDEINSYWPVTFNTYESDTDA